MDYITWHPLWVTDETAGSVLQLTVCVFLTHTFNVFKSVYMSVCWRSNLLNKVSGSSSSGPLGVWRGRDRSGLFSTNSPSVFTSPSQQTDLANWGVRARLGNAGSASMCACVCVFMCTKYTFQRFYECECGLNWILTLILFGCVILCFW